MLIWSVATEACVNEVLVSVCALKDMKVLLANEQAAQDSLVYAMVMEYVRPSNSWLMRTMVILTNCGIGVARWDVTAMQAFMAPIVPRYLYSY